MVWYGYIYYTFFLSFSCIYYLVDLLTCRLVDIYVCIYTEEDRHMGGVCVGRISYHIRIIEAFSI